MLNLSLYSLILFGIISSIYKQLISNISKSVGDNNASKSAQKYPSLVTYLLLRLGTSQVIVRLRD